jgi:hypothetical protein
VHEAARLGVRGALRRCEAQHELLGIIGTLREDARLLEEDGAPGGTHAARVFTLNP